MLIYLLYHEAMLGFPQRVAVVSNIEIKDRFIALNRNNRFLEYELDPENIIDSIKNGNSTAPWTEFWRKKDESY